MTSVAVITPTIGTDTLEKCLKSVKEQTYGNIIHHIFIDGNENFHNIDSILRANWSDNIRVNILDENVGKGWYGHRVYAASSFIVNQDVLVYLDEDNWLQPDHIETQISTLNSRNLDWVYSLRKIYDVEGNYVCDDNCESLGKWSAFHSDDFTHVDTSCYAVRRENAINVGHCWYGQWGADRHFFSALKQVYPNFDCTRKHTLCYRLGGNEGSVSKQFFIEGNQVQLNKYGSEGNYPWLKASYEVGPGIHIEL
jgi:glycosyltransferase involved in cell wall biosynthesis